MLFAGRYRLQQKLGEGAFGSVWRAEQEAFGIVFRQAALKQFETPLEGGIQIRNVFADALGLIRLLENCDDPLLRSRFIQIYDIGAVKIESAEDGPQERGYITMELMEKDLRSVIGETGSARFRKCTMKEALDYLRPVLEALAFMHRQKPPMLHRDLKPANILLKQGDEVLQVKVADFGLAIQHFHTVERPQAAGTMQYQDLESFTEETSSTESDVFALGIIFYELLTGKYPFHIDFTTLDPRDLMSKEVLREKVKRAMKHPPTPPSHYNFELKSPEYRHIEDAIMQSLACNRIDRIADAGSLLGAIGGGPSMAAVRTAEEQYRYHLKKARTAQYQGKPHWREAEEEYRTAIAAMPDACDAYVQLADLYIEQQQLDKGELLLTERGGKQMKPCIHVYRKLAELHQARGNKMMAEYFIDKLSGMPPCEYSVFHRDTKN